MSSKTSKPTALALGAALALTGGSTFAMEPLAQGYMVSASSVAEGSCGAEYKKAQAAKEMKAEGNCGLAKMDADKDGKISKAEFAAAHDNDDSKFAEHDTNKDGFISADELEMHMGGAGGEGGKAMEEGKCGEGKCGAEG